MTFLEQRRAYEQLEPVWSGSLERAGTAPGLSGYVGPSSIQHSPAWPAELKQVDIRGDRAAGPKPTDQQLANVRGLLQRGLSLRRVASLVGVKVGYVRREREALKAGNR
jgi:hypothetical protein